MNKETNDPDREIRVFISSRAEDLDHVRSDILALLNRHGVPPAINSSNKSEIITLNHHGKWPQPKVLNAEHIKPFNNQLSPDNGIDLIIVDGFDQLNTPTSSIPLRFGERLLNLMLSEEARESLIGDLFEEYAELDAKFGSQFAKAWYRQQIRSSLFSIFKEITFKRLFARAIEWFRKLT